MSIVSLQHRVPSSAVILNRVEVGKGRSSSGLLWYLSSLTILWWIRSMREYIVLHKCHLFLECRTFLFYPWYQILLKELGISCWVNFDTILNFKRSHQFVAYDASPDHHTISTLLLFEPSWCCSTICNPSMWPPIRTIQCCQYFVCEDDKIEILLQVLDRPCPALCFMDLGQWRHARWLLCGATGGQNLTPCCPVYPGKPACWFEGDSSSPLPKAVNSPALGVWPWISWFSLSRPCWHCWSSSLIVLWSWPSIFAISSVEWPSPISCTTLSFSSTHISLFFPLLQCGGPNNTRWRRYC